MQGDRILDDWVKGQVMGGLLSVWARAMGTGMQCHRLSRKPRAEDQLCKALHIGIETFVDTRRHVTRPSEQACELATSLRFRPQHRNRPGRGDADKPNHADTT